MILLALKSSYGEKVLQISPQIELVEVPALLKRVFDGENLSILFTWEVIGECIESWSENYHSLDEILSSCENAGDVAAYEYVDSIECPVDTWIKEREDQKLEQAEQAEKVEYARLREKYGE